MEVKDLVKPPFANYDVVVYFGCGLFCLPLIYHYMIEPAGLRFPRFRFDIGMPFADTAISTLSLLFTVYILGHMIAYAASYFVEKTVEVFCGKISSSILISTLSSNNKYPETLQAWIFDHVRDAFKKGRRLFSVFRLVVLAPVAPAITIMFLTKSFDYFRTRVPRRVMEQVRQRCKRLNYGPVGLRTKWYKLVEHDVINNNQNASARMYNYLVISGIFRSLSLLFLASAWAEIIWWTYGKIKGLDPVKALLSDKPISGAHIAAGIIFNILFVFSLSAYIKFSRRYAEEAIFAFVLTREAKSLSGDAG